MLYEATITSAAGVKSTVTRCCTVEDGTLCGNLNFTGMICRDGFTVRRIDSRVKLRSFAVPR